MSENFFIKRPTAVKEYTWDWKALANGSGNENWLEDDETIATYTVTAPEGITIDSHSLTHNATSVTAWISGGVGHIQYVIPCQITTSHVPPRTDVRDIIIRVE